MAVSIANILDMPLTQILSYGALSVLFSVVLGTLFSFNKRGRLPPGPKAIPFVGNTFQVPARGSHLKHTEWAKAFGKIYYYHMFGYPVCVLNDYKTNVELLEGRSDLYSDRPITSYMATKLMGWDEGVGLRLTDNRQREMRKLIDGALSTQGVRKFVPIQEVSVFRLLVRLRESPLRFMDHVRDAVSESLIMVVFGRESDPDGFPYFEMSERANQAFALAAVPFSHFVDIFPILRFVPSWFPGADFKRRAKVLRKELFEFVQIPFEIVKNDVKQGTARPSYLSDLLTGQSRLSGEDESLYSWTAMSIYTGSVDALGLTLQAFILAMCRHPEVQRKAQREIDALTGGKRFAEAADLPALPYVEACFKELLRWHTVTPFGLAHRATQSDVYEDHYIPKDSTVVPNIWALSRDTSMYPDPDEFRPERHLPDANGRPTSVMEPRKWCFGWGRRICPGIHLAESVIPIFMMHILATFTIGRVKDAKGVEHVPKIEHDGTALLRCVPFKCSVTVRNKALLDMLSEPGYLDYPIRL